MSKPIFIIRFPYTENKEIKTRFLGQIEEIRMTLKDYHILTPMDNSIERVEFECYNAINATDVEIEELKQMVLEKIKANE